MLKRYVVYAFLFLALGFILGVFFSNYSYFTISKEISISDLWIFVMTSLVGFYIASNIQKALARRSTLQTLYSDDIKGFIQDLKFLEDKIQSGSIGLNELTAHLKKGNIRLRSIVTIYGSVSDLYTNDLPAIVNDHARLKMTITALAPSNGTINFTPAQQTQFYQAIEGLKVRLVNAIIDCQKNK